MLTALITRRSCTELGLAVGAEVVAGVKATAIHVLPDDKGL
jgi:molybdopterin-binding protein